MLEWSNLSRGKKLGASFLVFLFVVSGPLMVFLADTAIDSLFALGLLLVGIGIILNPASFSHIYGTPLDIFGMPKVCQWLIIPGLIICLGIKTLRFFA